MKSVTHKIIASHHQGPKNKGIAVFSSDVYFDDATRSPQEEASHSILNSILKLLLPQKK